MQRHSPEPIIGNWYDSKAFPECFSVVDVERGDYIEIQYLDGEIDKIDIEAWEAMHPSEIPAPEDPNAPYGLEHDNDIVNLLNEIEEQGDLEEHLRNIDHDENSWM